jgi:hypothetical protein
MEILKIQIMTGREYADDIYFYTDVCTPIITSEGPIEKLILHSEATRGYALEYVTRFFPGIPVEIEER